MSVDEPLTEETETADETPDATDLDREVLEGRVELLEAENERLRDLYARTRRTAYRRTALGLALLGSVAVAGGVLFDTARDVLFVLGAIGLFGGILTLYLTPERFVAADVAERVYDALATNGADLSADLGLSDTHVYLPNETGTGSVLFVPQDSDDPLPDVATIEGPLVVTDETRGLALEPSAAGLFTEFERTLSGPLGDTPGTLARQVTDALVEAFELVDGTDTDLDSADGRLTVSLRGSAYPNAFDSPPASLLGVALAVGLDRPVRVESAPSSDGDFSVTCRWEPDKSEESDEPEEASESEDSAEPDESDDSNGSAESEEAENQDENDDSPRRDEAESA